MTARDDSEWTLPTLGDLEWQSVVELCGLPVEGSIPTNDDWNAAKREGRVVTIHHSDTGKPYFARVGLHTHQVMCRVVFGRPLPPDVVLRNVNLDDLDYDFAAPVNAAAQATELLMRAASENDAGLAKAALRAGANVDCTGQALSIAVEKGHFNVVKLLIEEGLAELSAYTGAALWRMATLCGHDDIAAFIAGHNIDPPVQKTLLQAVREGNRDVVERLLARALTLDSDVSFSAPFGAYSLDRPLIVAAETGNDDLVAFLLAKGANVNASYGDDVTPWAAAAAAGAHAVCTRLEAAGAKAQFETALLLASQLGNVDVVQELINQGVNPNARASVGRITPLEAACESRASDPRSRLNTIELLLASGADPNTCTQDGTPLTFRAVYLSRADVLKSLLRHGADVELQEKESGETAIVWAAENNDVDCAMVLLTAGAKTSVKNKNGQPLLIAMLKGDPLLCELADVLIEYGADVNATDSTGRTLRQHLKRIIRKREDDEGNADQAECILKFVIDSQNRDKYTSALPDQASAIDRWKRPDGMIYNSIGMRFVPIPSGEFMMGAPEDEPGMNGREEFLHPVHITRSFYLGTFTVTQKEYATVVGNNPSYFRGDNLPVEHVSWREAMEFCKRLTDLPEERVAGRVYRLPTEAEWEYACRAGTSTAFSWGATLDHDVANFCNEYRTRAPRRTVPVGSFPPNAFGVHEMHGNVWEWCRDWYQLDYYEQSPYEDPTGPVEGHHHVFRGGSASVRLQECRAAMRGEASSRPVDSPNPENSDARLYSRFQAIGDFGFRVVCQIPSD